MWTVIEDFRVSLKAKCIRKRVSFSSKYSFNLFPTRSKLLFENHTKKLLQTDVQLKA
jgi:hypothetical protein